MHSAGRIKFIKIILCAVLAASIRCIAPSFNVSVGDCTPTEKQKHDPPPIEAGDIFRLVIYSRR